MKLFDAAAPEPGRAVLALTILRCVLALLLNVCLLLVGLQAWPRRMA